MGHRATPAARHPRARQGWRLRRVQEGAGTAQARPRRRGARGRAPTRQQGLSRGCHREHPAAGKNRRRLTGPIRGTRLPAEVKRWIVGAVTDAKKEGMPITRACEILMIDSCRVRRWIGGRDSQHLQAADLVDTPPVARVCPHKVTDAERAEIVTAARDEKLAHLRHRKLTHTLSRQKRVFCSPSTTLRVLRSESLVPVYHHRSRPQRPRPETDVSEPNTTWRYDITELPTLAGPYHLVPVLDACSRKITGRYFGPEQTSAAVQVAWDKALADEGLLAEDAQRLPAAASDRGTQMTSKSTQQFFFDLGIVQSFSRARTPTDNAACEAWIATIKCERLYEADTADMTPEQVESMVDRFIRFYNEERLHQAIDYVTPAERHDGRHTAITEARRRGMQEAKERRRMEAYGGVSEVR
ncbi:MAG: IS3 family transposase [Actinobacteria bacterium]|nr:IS3 family transposase [Actinomycetota bacterium]